MAEVEGEVSHPDQFALVRHAVLQREEPAQDSDIFAHLGEGLAALDTLLPGERIPVGAEAEVHAPGARLSRVAKVMATSAGPRVQLLTMQLPSRTRSVVAAMAPSTETRHARAWSR